MTTEQTIQAELDAHNVKMALENGTNTVKASYVSKVADGDRGCITCTHNNEEWDSDNCDGCCENHSNYDRAISLNEWHEQAKDVKYSANNLTTICVKPQDRAISLNAVKDLFCRICMEIKICYRSKETCVDLRLFDKLPSVTPTKEAIEEAYHLGYEEGQKDRPTGHWIFQTEDKYQCSCCGEVIRVKEVMNEPQYITCPMCDARMVGDDNEV